MWSNMQVPYLILPTVVLADRLENKATPWLMLPPEVDPTTGDKLDCFYSLADSQTVKLNRKKSLKVPDTAICMASTLGSWLGFANPKDPSLYLSNPFSNDVVELPSLATLPRVMAVQRDSTGSILHLKVAFPDYPGFWNDPHTLDGSPDFLKPESMVDYMISRLAISSEDPRNADCVAMAVQGEMSRLAYCKTNSNNKNNNVSDSDSDSDSDAVWYGLQEDYHVTGLTDQIVYSSKNGLFYSLCDEGIQAFDVERDRGRRTKKVSQFYDTDIDDQREEGLPKWLNKLLSESRCNVEYYLLTIPNNRDLWLIVRYLDKRRDDDYSIPTLHFDVFRVVYLSKLERVVSLDDIAIFIGSNQSFCIKAGDFPGIRPNSIYFTDVDAHINRSTSETKWEWGHDMGVFDMKNGDITQFYHYRDEEEEKKVPFTMPLFWIAPFSK